MSSQLRLHPCVLAARELLAEGRLKLRKQYDAGSPGIQLGFFLTDILDEVVLQVFNAALDAHPDARRLLTGISLVAHSGYGRRDNAPYSDVDLMLLHSQSVTALIPEFAGRLVQDLSDVGLLLGFSVRTPRQAFQLAARDAVICTALIESRYLAGSESLLQNFNETFLKKFGNRRSSALLKVFEQSRRDERRKYGETVYLLEPNIKRSRGGLRDLHLLRWIGFAAYGQQVPRKLKQMGPLNADDHAKLRDARDFLLLLRYALHFEAGSAQDALTKPEQLRIADLGDYAGDKGVLPVERFMQEYFRHTTNVRHIVSNFVAQAKWNSPGRMAIHNLFGRPIDRDYLVGARYVSARKKGYERVHGDLVEVLRLMDMSNRYAKRIDHNLWQVIRHSMVHAKIEAVSMRAAGFFFSLLSEGNRLGSLLRRLHEVYVLENLIPGWDHVRCLLQFNDYHKYTVDEHSLRAVEAATDYEDDDGILGNVYRNVKHKSTLHLALLIHDIGKGYVEDHSEVGARIAREVAEHLSMPPEEADRLVFLVHRHLMLTHLAFRRDNSDQAILLEVASEIGSPENLQMLFVLTCADLTAVGPGVMNQWKLEVLSDLYQRIMETLSGGADATTEQRLAPLRDELKETAANDPDYEWICRQVDALPPAYLRSPSAVDLFGDLKRLRAIPRESAAAWGRYVENSEVSEYSVGAHQDIATGVFYRLAGALASHGLEILSAEIHSLSDSLLLDKFFVRDPDFQGKPPAGRFDEVSSRLVNALHAEVHEPPTFRRVWQGNQNEKGTLTALSTRIRVDNSTSDRYTILDIFAHDRPGLLYCIAKSLHEQGLDIGIAKIGTYLDQVVDVFYVTDELGNKVQDELFLMELRSKLYHAIESWEV